MFAQGTFFNSGVETPEQLAAKRAAIQAMMPQYGTARYVGQGVGQLATGIAAGLAGKKLDKIESEKRQQADQAFFGILGYGAGQGAGRTSAGQGAGYSAPPRDPMAPESIAADTMATLGKGVEGEIFTGLTQRGMPPHIAQAFVDNMRDESGLNPAVNEQSPLVAGSRGGFGLNQWTGPRRVALEQFAAERGKPASDLQTQLDFTMAELQGPESKAAQRIFAAPDRGQAAAAIVNDFLRPAEVHRSAREARYLGGAQPNANAALPQIPVDQLMSVLSNPWIDQNQRQVITTMLNNQMQAGDPMRQMEMQQAQLGLQKTRMELDAMGQPQAPEYRMLTPQEVQMMGLPEGTYQQSADGKIAPIGGGGVTVNNDLSGGGKFEEAFAKGDADTIKTVYDAGLAAQRNLGRIDQLGALLSSAPQGGVASLQAAAGRFGIKTEGLDELQAAQALINSLVPEQRQPGSGPMSDADLALFKQSLPQIINQPSGNTIILDTMRKIAQYDAEGASIVQQLRNGEIDRAQAFTMLQGRVNPLQNMAGGQPQGGAAPDPDGWITTPEGFKIREKK